MRRAIRWTLIVGLMGTVITATLVVGLHEAPPSVAVVSQIRPATIDGLDHPVPGTAAFHFTFLVSLHSTGSPRSTE